MDITRAREILDSPEKIDVSYMGDPVWITNINSNNTVTVKMPVNSNHSIDVPVDGLVEKTE